MTFALRLSPILALAAFGLAACDDNNDNNAGGDTPQEQIGSTFAEAFNADPNSQPVDVQPGDAGDLSLTADPVDF